MDILDHNHEQRERENTLQKIKEYILSLVAKKRKRKEEERDKPIKKQITETLTENDEKKEDREENAEENAEESTEESTEESMEESMEESTKDFTEGHSEEEKRESDKEKEEIEEMETPPEDRDEYVPQDSEFGEALWESARFAEIYPPFLGYYVQGKKSYFDRNTNLRSKKRQLSDVSHKITEGSKKYTYAGVIIAGITAIPLPDTALPDTDSLCFNWSSAPVFKKDQNNCIYLQSKHKQYVSFDFALGQVTNTILPIMQDKEKIVFDHLTKETQTLLEGIAGKMPPLAAAKAIKSHIIATKKYSTKVQWTLRNTSNSHNYIKHLDESPVLECFSANSLFVGLCRELGMSARLCVGQMVQSVAKDKKAHLTKNQGHARSEVRDEEHQQRVRFDATPTIKEDGEKSDENWQEQGQSDQNADDNFGDDQESNGEEGEEQEWKDSDKEWKDSDKEGKDSDKEGKESDKESESDSEKDPSKQKKWGQSSDSNKAKQKTKYSEKSPAEMLDELIDKAKEDNLTEQAEKIQETLDKLEKAKNKEEMKKALDESGLDDFAKDMIDKVGNEWILEEEKKELEHLTDEKEIEQKLKDSLLNDDYKDKLKKYADTLKEKIQEEKKRMRSEMENYGFKENEIQLYKMYKILEKEVEPQVKKQIAELQKLLPPNYQILRDEENYYRSGYKLDRTKLVDRKITGDTKVFQRNKTELDTNEINMFETILIDKSWSMGRFGDPNSPLTNAIKAAIIRAKVLEHFKVQMNIIIFGDKIEEVMTFDEKFSDRTTKIPSKLMRIATGGGWGNSQEPMTYAYSVMKRKMKELGGKSFGNVSFIGDGDLYQFQQIPELRALIQDLRRSWMGVTAYYINNAKEKMPLIEYYFWSPQDGGAVYAGDVQDLSNKIVTAHRTRLSHIISKFLKR